MMFTFHATVSLLAELGLQYMGQCCIILAMSSGGRTMLTDWSSGGRIPGGFSEPLASDNSLLENVNNSLLNDAQPDRGK